MARKFNWDKLNEKIQNVDGKKQNYSDISNENLYEPKLDDNGNANVIIRFLPPAIGEEDHAPFIKKYRHFFQDVNGWFVADCPTTINKNCPVCSYNKMTWGEDEDTTRGRSRKSEFFANILIVKDEQSPENNGKVFKYKYGVKLHDKIMEAIDVDNINPFDYENGANFRLRIKTTKGFWGGKERSTKNIDSSVFLEPSPIALDGKELTPDQIKEIDKMIYPLQPIIADDIFKTDQQLVDMFFIKTGVRINMTGNGAVVPENQSPQAPTSVKTVSENDFSQFDDEDEKVEAPAPPTPEVDDEDDDDFFRRLREQN